MKKIENKCQERDRAIRTSWIIFTLLNNICHLFYNLAQANKFSMLTNTTLAVSSLHQELFNFWKSSGRWALVSLVLLLISLLGFLTFGLEEMPWNCAALLLFAVLVAGFIPFFWRSFSISIISRGNSISRKRCFRSSSTLIGTLGSLG